MALLLPCLSTIIHHAASKSESIGAAIGRDEPKAAGVASSWEVYRQYPRTFCVSVVADQPVRTSCGWLEALSASAPQVIVGQQMQIAHR